MAQVSISEAARLTGKSRKTLHTYISNGKLTKVTDTQGKPKIDTSELIRVFGELVTPKETVTSQCNFSQEVTPNTVTINDAEIERLKQEVSFLKELLIEKDKRNDDLKHALLLIESKLPTTPEPVAPEPTKKPWQFWKK
ncbi:DNA-binding protein [Proteus mirabilis]|uniref:DNA-binding protein n=1 Tax=Proteus mirabilis TaxID=584 RepID=UPI0023F940AD|nr:DNA-binding protein [Proteus mirabilis]MDF7466653.1 DNA-binding protein [Proteus mirabilis]